MATDYFMKIDGIPGDTTDAKHPSEIKVTSWSWGETNASAFGGTGFITGKSDLQDFQFTAITSMASPLLFFNCASGTRPTSAAFTARQAGGAQSEYLKITLTDVLISSYQVAGNQADNVPVDHVSLDFAKIQVTFNVQNPNGSTTAITKTWDKVQSKGA